jgi:hypothetical protein
MILVGLDSSTTIFLDHSLSAMRGAGRTSFASSVFLRDVEV